MAIRYFCKKCIFKDTYGDTKLSKWVNVGDFCEFLFRDMGYLQNI